MISKTFYKRLIFILLFTCVKPSIGLSAEIIASSHVKTTTLSLKNLRHIFFMRQHEWADETPIKVYVLNDNNSLHKEFSKENLGVFPYKLRRSWDRNVFSGTGQAPTVLENESEMIRVISNSHRAIGYASKEAISNSNKGSINVLFIQGK